MTIITDVICMYAHWQEDKDSESSKRMDAGGSGKANSQDKTMISHIEKAGKINDDTLKQIFHVLDVSESSIEHVMSEKHGVFTKGQPGSTEYYLNEIVRLNKQIELLMQMLETQKEEIARLRKKKPGRQ